LLKARVLISDIYAPSLNSTEQESQRDPGLEGKCLHSPVCKLDISKHKEKKKKKNIYTKDTALSN
jgi:hypothetical protein